MNFDVIFYPYNIKLIKDRQLIMLCDVTVFWLSTLSKLLPWKKAPGIPFTLLAKASFWVYRLVPGFLMNITFRQALAILITTFHLATKWQDTNWPSMLLERAYLGVSFCFFCFFFLTLKVFKQEATNIFNRTFHLHNRFWKNTIWQKRMSH